MLSPVQPELKWPDTQEAVMTSSQLFPNTWYNNVVVGLGQLTIQKDLCVPCGGETSFQNFP